MLINIRINDAEKFELFSKTFSDICKLFDEIHIKIRGSLSASCLEYVKLVNADLSCTPIYYQNLSDDDWVNCTLQMLNKVKSRSVFLYFEDHVLLRKQTDLSVVLKEFDANNINFLSYSFFKASKLEVNNLLPLNPTHHNSFSSFSLNDESIELLNSISENYYLFSLVSICSVDYLRFLMEMENSRYKIYNKYLSAIFAKLFPYPLYRVVFSKINVIFSYLSVRLNLYPVNSPFNMEKMLREHCEYKNLRVGLLKNELFANFDDDNGSYKESLIKRGLYPFSCIPSDNIIDNLNNQIVIARFIKEFSRKEEFPLTYYCRKMRITTLPIVKVHCLKGTISIRCSNEKYRISTGEEKYLYSNVVKSLISIEQSKVEISIYEEN